MCFYVKRQLEYGITPAQSTALIPVPIPLPLAPSRMEPATAGGSTVTPLPVPVAPIPAPTVNPSMMKALAMDDEDATSSRDSSPTSEQ
ncbi:hypothetical protein FS842_001496 [Serendipita sp. 407]|nr:hypothetical protein FS842_001496 [Serendipita sp. 407]